MDRGEGGAAPRTPDDLPRQEAAPHLQVKGGHRGRGASGGVARRWGVLVRRPARRERGFLGPGLQPSPRRRGRGTAAGPALQVECSQVRRAGDVGPACPPFLGRSRRRAEVRGLGRDGGPPGGPNRAPGAQTERGWPGGREGLLWDSGSNSVFLPCIKQESLYLPSPQGCRED